MDLSIRRFMLLRLNDEKQEVLRDLELINKTLQHIRSTEQTVRHCKKEALEKLLDDPELRTQYDSMVSKLKEIENGNRPKSEERTAPLASDNEQLSDGP